MNMVKTTILAGAVALAAPAASAATVVIDDFTIFQQVIFDQNSTNMVGGVGDFAADRTFNLTSTPGGASSVSLTSTGNGQVPQIIPEDTLILASGGASQEPTAEITYDYDPGGVDLTDGGLNNQFFFDGVIGDLAGASLTTTVTSFGGASATFAESLDTFDPFTDFSEFAGVDFSQVTSILFVFDGPAGFDGQLSSISTVPLPASALLLLGGMGGLAAFGSAKRRRKKA